LYSTYFSSCSFVPFFLDGKPKSHVAVDTVTAFPYVHG
jgi:hypothetical protein